MGSINIKLYLHSCISLKEKNELEQNDPTQINII